MSSTPTPDPPALDEAALARLEALAAAASPGPWRAEGADIRCPHRLKQFRVAVVSLAFRGSAAMDADAAFIAAARQAVPRLVAELRRSRERAARMRHALENVVSAVPGEVCDPAFRPVREQCRAALVE